MGLRKVWRKVRSLAQRQHNLLAISDLHLGCDLRPGARFDKPRPADPYLISFLDWHAANRRDGKPWRLILDGDIVDFVAITLVPAEAPFEISAEERRIGLVPTEPKCVWKLRRTAERHREVFDALARFVQKGNSVHIIRGNHDSEWRWPAVQEELRRVLAERGARRPDRLVHFHDWFYLEPGFFYAEHGHAHDPYSVQSEFFEEQRGEEIQLPLSSKVLRYFANRYTEQVELPDDVDAWGLREYIDWVLRAGNPLRVAADYFVMVFRVIYPIFRQALKFTRATRPPKATQIHQLRSIASRPAEQSLFDSMQLFYLDRMLLALLCLVCAWSTSAALEGFWAKGAALTGVGIAFAAVNALLGRSRRTDAHPMLQEAARRVAQVLDVKYIVMGHSHRALEQGVGNGTRYFNLGAWTGRAADGFCHVVVTAGSAELRRWKGPGAMELPLQAA
ncbi:MAG TPA: metallophosphoesterase [Myxococcales bacterium]|nr:metallophosphoesterase [Myxococcales bacterium]